MSIGHAHRADPSFLAVRPHVTFVTNLVYFPPCVRLLSKPKRSVPWLVQNYTAWWQRHIGVSSLPKVITQWWCPTRTRTCDLSIASPLPHFTYFSPRYSIIIIITHTCVNINFRSLQIGRRHTQNL